MYVVFLGEKQFSVIQNLYPTHIVETAMRGARFGRFYTPSATLGCHAKHVEKNFRKVEGAAFAA